MAITRAWWHRWSIKSPSRADRTAVHEACSSTEACTGAPPSRASAFAPGEEGAMEEADDARDEQLSHEGEGEG